MTWINGEWVDAWQDQGFYRWCPGCPPPPDDANLTQNWEVWYCEAHKPPVSGDKDHLIDSSSYLTGATEAGGPDAILFANLIHRGDTT